MHSRSSGPAPQARIADAGWLGDRRLPGQPERRMRWPAPGSTEARTRAQVTERQQLSRSESPRAVWQGQIAEEQTRQRRSRVEHQHHSAAVSHPLGCADRGG